MRSRINHITCRVTLSVILETIKVKFWGKDIKHKEGKQNNKQEMQKTGGGGRGYVACKEEK